MKMKIRKGDILYKCNSNNVSDKDYCSKELLAKLTEQGLDCSSDDFDPRACPNFSKCWQRPQRVMVTRLRITNVMIDAEGIDTSSFGTIYYCVDMKYNTRNKFTSRDVKYYSKSEQGAYRKFLIRLNRLIANIEKELWDISIKASGVI